MIGVIAFKFLNSTYGRYILGALALLTALTAWGRSKRKQGERQARREQSEFVRDRTERGKDAFHESQREAVGRSVDDLLDSMRGNDRHWGRLPDL